MKYCIKLFCCLRPYMAIFEQIISTHAKKTSKRQRRRSQIFDLSRVINSGGVPEIWE